MSKNQAVERVNDLNSQQWKLYSYLVSQNKLVSLKTIYREFENYYPDFGIILLHVDKLQKI